MMDAKSLSLADLAGFDAKPKKSGQNTRYLCPLCHGDRKRDDAHRSLSANIKTGAWWCHRCQEKGLLIEFRDQTGQPQYKRPKPQRLTVMPGSIQATTRPKPDEGPKDREYDYEAIAGQIRPLESTPAAAYLERRGIPIKAIPKGARVRYMPAVPALEIRESLAFGLSDPKGQTVGIQLRNIQGTFKPIYKKTDAPYIFATPGAIEAECPIITEAPIDALTLAACGFPSIATVGTNFPDELAQALALKTVHLAQDNDAAGDKAATKAAIKLRELGAIPVRLRPAGAKDWNEYAQKWGIDALRQALETALKKEDNAPAPTSNPEISGDPKTKDPQEPVYFGHSAPEQPISVFMATRPPNFAQMDEKAQNANAWAQWVDYYSKRPNAPDLNTVPECTAYVLTQWVKEQP